MDNPEPTDTQRQIVFFSQCGELHYGGVERYIQQLIANLRDYSTFCIVGPMSDAFVDECKAANENVLFVRSPRYGKYDLTAIVAIARLLRSLNATLIHTVEPRGRFLGHVAAKVVGIPAVHTHQITSLSYDTSFVRRAFYGIVDMTLNRFISDRIIFVSRADYAQHLRHRMISPSNAEVIYNSIDLSHFHHSGDERSAARADLLDTIGGSQSDIVICTIARLTDQKDVGNLVYAADILRAEEMAENLKFVIVGDGVLRKSIERIVSDLKLQDRIRILGYLPRDKTYQILLGADLYVLPSRYECFPFSNVEAVAAGLPAVVTDVGGNREIILDGQNGIVVPPGDPVSLARAIKALAVDPALRKQFSIAAHQVASSFSVDNMVAGTNAIYDCL